MQQLIDWFIACNVLHEELPTLHTSIEIHCLHQETRSSLRLLNSTTANRKKMASWGKKMVTPRGTRKLCFVFDLLRISCILKKTASHFVLSLSLYHTLSPVCRQLCHDHKHLWGRVCVCVWGEGDVSVIWVLEGYKTAGVFLTFLRGPYLFSLARVGSAVRSEATSLPASRHTKKHAHTPAPTVNNNSSKLDGLKNAKILFTLKISEVVIHLHNGSIFKVCRFTLQPWGNSDGLNDERAFILVVVTCFNIIHVDRRPRLCELYLQHIA